MTHARTTVAAGRQIPDYRGILILAFLLDVTGAIVSGVGVLAAAASALSWASAQRRDTAEAFAAFAGGAAGVLAGVVALAAGLLLIGVGQIARAVRDIARNSFRPEPLPVQAAEVSPGVSADGEPGRFRVTGVVRATGVETKTYVRAGSAQNARAMVEAKGVTVETVERSD